MKIGYIIGSIRKDSFNRKLVNALMKLAPSDFTFHEIKISDLPLYSQDFDANPPAVFKDFKDAIRASDALIIATPEYNRSIPGVLKNALDIGSRPYGESAWEGKPVGVLGASIGTLGSALAQQHLRNILSYLDMPTMNQPEAFIHVKDGFFDAEGHFSEAQVKFFQKWMDSFVAWVKQHQH